MTELDAPAGAMTGAALRDAFPGAVFGPYHGVWPRVAADAFIAPGAVVVGDVVIGAQSNVWYCAVIRGDDHHIRIGARTNVQDGAIVHVFKDRHATIIGDDVTIGHGAKLHGCALGDRCLVGIGAIVLDGARVGRGALVAAGAVVAPGKTAPEGELWAGAPARRRRDLSAAERDFLLWNAAHYVRLGAEHAAETAAPGRFAAR